MKENETRTMPPAKESHTAGGPILSPGLFDRFSSFITNELGIKMPSSKRTMLQSRLQKRLRDLHLNSFDDYYTYVFSGPDRDREIIHLMDVVTTNKTDFYREPRHYEVLAQSVVPDLLRRKGIGVHRPLKIWSAGCSTGAEPYTLAMVLTDLASQVDGFKFRILATDISTRVLDIGINAIYDEHDAGPIPLTAQKKYLLRSKDRTRPRIRIAPELRRLVEFRRLNLMDDDYGMPDSMDIVFCRNVIIYFDRETQLEVLRRICHCIKTDAYLFMGHSETLNGLHLPLRQISANVYRKRP
jgi:chemotaxis protein methyltransferase CheR